MIFYTKFGIRKDVIKMPLSITEDIKTVSDLKKKTGDILSSFTARAGR